MIKISYLRGAKRKDLMRLAKYIGISFDEDISNDDLARAVYSKLNKPVNGSWKI